MFSNKRKLIGFIVGLIMFAITVTSLTYAYYQWQSSNTNITFNVDDSYFYCETDINSSINNLIPVNDYKLGVLHKFKVNNIANKNTTFSITMNISSIDDALKDPSFKYKLMVDKTNGSNNCQQGASACEAVANGEGTFENVHVGNNTLVSSISLPNDSRYEYYFFIYIDGNMSNPSEMQSASMVSTLGVCDIYVTFDTTEGDTTVTPMYKKVFEGETYGNLPTPVRNDAVVTYNYNNATGGNSVVSDTVSFTFNGWYKEQSFTNLVTSSTTVTSTINHTIYPKWTKSTTITLPTPTRTGYTFGGWYSDSTLTTKVGDGGGSYNPPKSTPLYAKWIGNIYTATFYYNSNNASGQTTIATTTQSCTVSNNSGSCAVDIPSAVRNSVGTYNNTYAGLSTTTGNMTEAVASNYSNVVLSTNITYYSLYRKNVNIYRPSSTSACSLQTLYRNQWFSSNSQMATTVLSASTDGTSNASNSSVASGYTFGGYATALSSNTVTFANVSSLASTSVTTVYAVGSKSIIPTFYYSSGTLGTKSSVQGTVATQYLRCKNINTAELDNSEFTVPTFGELAPTGTESVGWSNSATTVPDSPTTTPNTSSVNWYKVYRKTVTIYKPTSTSVCNSTNTVFYRNAFYGTSSTYTKVLATTNSGTTDNASYVSGINNYDVLGYNTTANNFNTLYNSLSALKNSDATTVYAILRNRTEANATFYYSSDATGTKSSVSGTSSTNNYIFCQNQTTARTNTSGGWVTVNMVEVAPYGTTHVGWATSSSSMSTSEPSASNTSFYAVYRASGIKNYYYDSGYTNRDLYRNAYYGSNAKYTLILSTSTSGTSCVSTAAGPNSSVWSGLATTATTTADYNSFCTYNTGASYSTTTDLYTVYRYDINYSVGSNVSAIGEITDSCHINATGLTTGTSSCSVTLPTITPNTGYISCGWNETNGAFSGTAAGTAYTLNTNNKRLYANAIPSVRELAFDAGDGNLSDNNTPYATIYNVSDLYDNEVYAVYGLQGFEEDINDFDEYILPVPTASKTGYIFNGWYTASSGGTKVLNANGTFTGTAVSGYTSANAWVLTESKTLYAQYTMVRYNISTTLVGGSFTGTTPQAYADLDEVVAFEKPSREFVITINLNGTGADLDNGITSVSKFQTFDGWTSASGLNTSTAMYGYSSDAVTNSWTNGLTKVGGGAFQFTTYFKNLATAGNTVNLTANWSAVTLSLPAVTKTGYTCGYADSNSATTYQITSSGNYTPSSTEINNGTNSKTLYVVCIGKDYYVHYNGTGSAYTDWFYEFDGLYNNVNSHNSSATEWLSLRQRTIGTVNSGNWGADYLEFNGTSTWVNLKTIFTENYDTATAECEFMLSAMPSGEVKRLITNLQGGGFGLAINASGKPMFYIYSNNVNDYVIVTGPSTLSTGIRYRLVGTYDGSTMYLYLNGEEIATTTTSGTIKPPNSDTVMVAGCDPVGSSCSGGYFNGRIYNFAYTLGTASQRSAESVVNDSGKVVIYGDTYGTIPTPVRNGYTFVNWYKEAALTNVINSSSTVATASDHTIYAKWSPITYNISYTLNGGTQGSSHPISATYGSIVNIDNPTRDGYTFAGWTATGDLSTNAAMRGSSNSHASMYSWDFTTKATQAYFKNLSTTASGSVTMTANWTAKTYTVNYYLGKADGTSPTKLGSSTCTFGSNCTLTTFANLNGVFPYSSAAHSADSTIPNYGWGIYGWSTSQTGTTRTYTNGQTTVNPSTYAATVNLYALGSKNYYFNGGNAPTGRISTATQIWNPYNTGATYLTSISVPNTVSISGWTFIGYEGSNNATNNTVCIASSNANTTYKPAYSDCGTGTLRSKYQRTLTVSYNGNSNTGGSTSNSTLTQYYNSGYGNAAGDTNTGSTLGAHSISLRANGFTRTGYTFSKWAEGSASGTQYAAGAAYTALGASITGATVSKTMYAIWTGNVYKVRFYGSGAHHDSDSNTIAKYSGLYNNGSAYSSSASNWKDMGPNSKNATISGGSWGSASSTYYRSFNGSSAYVNTTSTTTGRTMVVKFSVTSTPSSSATEQHIFGNWDNGGGGIYISNAHIRGQFWINGAYQTVDSGITPQANQIYTVHLILYNGTTLKIMVDGVVKATKTVSGSFTQPTNNTPVYMGCNPSGSTGCTGNYLNGKIYEAALVSVGISETSAQKDAFVNVTYGSKYPELPTPARKGYTFSGWYTAPSGGTKVTTSVNVSTASDHNLYARWTAS
ncbi:MAG: InlB B-repeat-containing protein [Bacilli bacterium]|nr:InlB B-repeat-containing protein [Bacilli bacterium]